MYLWHHSTGFMLVCSLYVVLSLLIWLRLLSDLSFVKMLPLWNSQVTVVILWNHVNILFPNNLSHNYCQRLLTGFTIWWFFIYYLAFYSRENLPLFFLSFPYLCIIINSHAFLCAVCYHSLLLLFFLMLPLSDLALWTTSRWTFFLTWR